MKNKLFFIYLMRIVGFLMLLTNGIVYLFDFDFNYPILSILGLLLIVFSMTIIKKNNK